MRVMIMIMTIPISVYKRDDKDKFLDMINTSLEYLDYFDYSNFIIDAVPFKANNIIEAIVDISRKEGRNYSISEKEVYSMIIENALYSNNYLLFKKYFVEYPEDPCLLDHLYDYFRVSDNTFDDKKKIMTLILSFSNVDYRVKGFVYEFESGSCRSNGIS
jgi:hypothetical protein